jgi:hypothetical protein
LYILIFTSTYCHYFSVLHENIINFKNLKLLKLTSACT